MAQAKVIDISSWQHPKGAGIDWNACHESGVQGVVVKLTQGVGYVNPFAIADLQAAGAAGLLIGAYHFALPSQNTAEAEARYFLDAIGGMELDLGVWCDVEEVGSFPLHELWQWVQTWCFEVNTPARPAGVYTDRDLLASMVGAPGPFRLWLAVPGDATGPVAGEWMTQWGPGTVEGVSGPCDLDTVWNTRGLNLPPGGSVPPPKQPPPPPVSPQGPQKGTVTVELPVLAQGATGHPVMALQTLLRQAGPTLVVDGNFGPLTEDAVRWFQGQAHITVDGVVGAQTWGCLLTGTPQ